MTHETNNKRQYHFIPLPGSSSDFLLLAAGSESSPEEQNIALSAMLSAPSTSLPLSFPPNPSSLPLSFPPSLYLPPSLLPSQHPSTTPLPLFLPPLMPTPTTDLFPRFSWSISVAVSFLVWTLGKGDLDPPCRSAEREGGEGKHI